jgi:hypothetical protein
MTSEQDDVLEISTNEKTSSQQPEPSALLTPPCKSPSRTKYAPRMNNVHFFRKIRKQLGEFVADLFSW